MSINVELFFSSFSFLNIYIFWRADFTAFEILLCCFSQWTLLILTYYALSLLSISLLNSVYRTSSLNIDLLLPVLTHFVLHLHTEPFPHFSLLTCFLMLVSLMHLYLK